MRQWLGLLALAFGISVQAQTPINLVQDPALSPDGSTLAFAWQGDLWMASSAGGLAKRLTMHPADDAQPAFSPDGKTLAFVSDREGGRQIWLMSVGGGVPRKLTSHTEGHRLLQWYPDGSGLLVSASRDHFWRHSERLMKQPLEDGVAPTLLFDAYTEEAALSPSGKYLFYVRESAPLYRKDYRGSQASQIWRYDFATKKHELLRKADFSCRWPCPVSDEMFGYISEQDGTFNVRQGLVGRKLENDVAVTSFEDDGALFLSIAADGRTAVFNRLFDLMRLDTKSGAVETIELYHNEDLSSEQIVKTIETSASEVSFSPDGKMMAFIAAGDLFVMDAVLKEPVRVTDTPEEESSPLFIDDQQVLFVSDAGGRSDIWSARPADEKLYFWQNTDFNLKAITADESREQGLRRVPGDEKLVAYSKDRGDLMLMKIDGSEPRRLVESWNGLDYDFSPDGRYIVYAQADDDFNNDVWIAPIDGSRPRFNLSCHPDNDGNPVWSPDGKIIAFTGRRFGDEVDVVWVHLTREGFEETDRDRKLEEALKAMEKGKKKSKPKAEETGKNDDAAKKDETAKAEDKKDEKKEADEKRTRIDFDGLYDRIRRISIPNSREGSLIFWPEGQKLLFRASVNGKSGLYSVEFPDKLGPKLFCDNPPGNLTVIPETKTLAGISSGKPAVLDKNGKVESHGFSLRHSYDLNELCLAIFDQAWRLMRDHFYDERLGNTNWDAIRRKYGPVARACRDRRSLAIVGNMMLGELNGSHLGFSVGSLPSSTKESRERDWSERTVHLGLRFEEGYKGPGWKVKDVIKGLPADLERSRIGAGEVILMIDGQTVDPAMDVASVLTLPAGERVLCRVRGLDGQERDVDLATSSYGAARAALYEMWIEDNQKRVDELSEGRFGYLHIRAMSGSNLLRFDEELYRVGHGKAGLVIDVRENGGGSITDHLLTCLTQPTHAITRPRGGGEGYPHDRRIYATWDKPIVVLCNQNSFSNAEIFSHAVKTLGRGRVVGVTTAGGVISTGGARIMGIAFIRMPFRGWYLLDGEDMELNGCQPHAEIWPAPGDWPAGIDTQLEKAVSFLAEDVKTFEAKPRPKLRKATER